MMRDTLRHKRGRPRKSPFTDEQALKIIREGRAKGLPYRDIALHLDWTVPRVIQKLRRADDPEYNPKYTRREWDDSEVEFLLDTWSQLSGREQAERLGRTMGSVEQRRALLRSHGLVESTERAFSRPWSAGDDARLVELAPDNTVPQLMVALNRSRCSIENRLIEMGVYSGTNLLTKSAIQTMFHVSKQTVRYWVEQGWLKIHFQSASRYAYTQFHVNDIRTFVRNHPYAYNPDYLLKTPFAVEAAQARRHPWIGVEEAAGIIGISPSQLRHEYANEIGGVRVKISGGTDVWRFPLSKILEFKEKYVRYGNHPIRGARKVA